MQIEHISAVVQEVEPAQVVLRCTPEQARMIAGALGHVLGRDLNKVFQVTDATALVASIHPDWFGCLRMESGSLVLEDCP